MRLAHEAGPAADDAGAAPADDGNNDGNNDGHIVEDPMHCIHTDADALAWEGTQDEARKLEQFQWYAVRLIDYLQQVKADAAGYAGAGYISVHSLLTSAMVMGSDQDDPWE
eukprot:13420598-Heterocapsa_arctica.AAC.1